MKHRLMIPAVVAAIVLSLLPTMVRSGLADQEKKVTMEILFMNHGPMQPTIRELQALIAKYPDKVQAGWFDFDQPAGKSFMKAKNLTGHIPLIIFINNSPVYRIDGREVTFMGFPSGAGPYQFQGKWSVKDLEVVIQSLLSQN